MLHIYIYDISRLRVKSVRFYISSADVQTLTRFAAPASDTDTVWQRSLLADIHSHALEVTVDSVVK